MSLQSADVGLLRIWRMILNAEDIADIRSKSWLRTRTFYPNKQQWKVDLKAGFTRNYGFHCNACGECPCWCAEKVRRVYENSWRSGHSVAALDSDSLVRPANVASQVWPENSKRHSPQIYHWARVGTSNISNESPDHGRTAQVVSAHGWYSCYLGSIPGR